MIPQILIDAKRESDRLDIEVCEGVELTPEDYRLSDKREKRAQRAVNVEAYRTQVETDGEIRYDVNELELYKNQLAFCEKMVSCNLMDFDE